MEQKIRRPPWRSRRNCNREHKEVTNGHNRKHRGFRDGLLRRVKAERESSGNISAASRGSVAVTASFRGSSVFAATSIVAVEEYSAQIHKMAAAITGNTAVGGRTSWATGPGTTIHGSAWTTGLVTTELGCTESLRLGSPEVGQVPRD